MAERMYPDNMSRTPLKCCSQSTNFVIKKQCHDFVVATTSSMAQQTRSLIPVERIQQAIFLIRGEKVMLDFDLAALYGVEIRVLVQAVKRNIARFPDDFMFQLTKEEYGILRSQIVILKLGRGQHRKYLPYAFTEQGVAMLSSVLNSERAVKVNIEIMRVCSSARNARLE
jgi:hypothetical protein